MTCKTKNVCLSEMNQIITESPFRKVCRTGTKQPSLCCCIENGAVTIKIYELCIFKRSQVQE